MSVLLKGGQVLDFEKGQFVQKDILLNGNKILAVATNLQTGSEIIDCSGKWIIPGLIDMHVHIKMGFAPLFTAAGVTTVRNMAGSLYELHNMIEAPSDAPTPRIISTDRLIDGSKSLWGETGPFNLSTDDERKVIEEVRRQVKEGASFIKVYNKLMPETMRAAVEEAKLHHKEVSCDLIHSTQVNAVDAADMGIDWNEHASGFIQAMYPQWSTQAEANVWNEIPWDEPDEDSIIEICRHLIKKGVKLCPTIAFYDQARLLENYWKITHPVIDKAFENQGLIAQWQMFLQHSAGLELLGRQHKIIKKIAYLYHQAGGTVVTGTDTPAGIFTFPGMALHRELELFVESGFTEIEALSAATINAAKALQRIDLGNIIVGNMADLAILENNPLVDIKHTRKISLVVKGGKAFTPKDLLNAVPSDEEVERFLEKLLQHFEEVGLLPKNQQMY